ncbi:MAG: DUF2157 domain-containing protein [Nitrospiraceae bacterium]|nr:DUF2157 domain-containing protein [Nitrospiraceae bacterium]
MADTEQEIAFSVRLRQELRVWLDEGLITPEQKDRILSRYQRIAEADEKAGPGRLITTVSVLGSILIGIGVILFVASNWSEVPRWGKLGIIFSSMVINYAAGFYLRYEKKNYPKVGASLILLGSIIFGAGIFLIAQIYHISVHYPNGPLLWGLGALPLAYLLRFRSLLFLCLLDLLVWQGMESSFHVSLIAYRPLPFVMLFLMTGICLWTMGMVHRGFGRIADLAGPYSITGLLLTMGGTYIFTFDVFGVALGDIGLIWFYCGIIGLFLLSALLYALSGEKERLWGYEMLGLVALMSLAVALSFLYKRDPLTPYRALSSTLPVLASNMLLALEIIGVITLGYIRRNAAYINIGIIFFVLDVTARYFDFFWKLLDRSIFFIAGGVILVLGGVFLEKKRRKVLAAFSKGGQQ